MQEPKKEDFGWSAPMYPNELTDKYYDGWWQNKRGEQEYNKAVIDYENRGNRRTGRTTRLIDKAIQELFTTGSCIILDHTYTEDGNRSMFQRTIDRIRLDHFKGLDYLFNTAVSLDVKTLTITLNDYEKRT